jgi:hypothetical protein
LHRDIETPETLGGGGDTDGGVRGRRDRCGLLEGRQRFLVFAERVRHVTARDVRGA